MPARSSFGASSCSSSVDRQSRHLRHLRQLRQMEAYGLVGSVVIKHPQTAVDALRLALNESSDPLTVTLSLPREVAAKVLDLLEAEGGNGAVVIPVKEQFTTTEAAKLLGISRTTLMKLVESGAIDSVKVASHHRIPALAIRDYEQSRNSSRGEAAAALREFARDAKTGFQRNVTFGGED